MQVSKKSLNSNQVIISIAADESELSKIKGKVLTNLSKSIKIPGFRSGKAPSKLVEKTVNPATLQSEFLDEAINSLLRQAISKETYKVIGDPEISLKKFVPFTTLEFEAIFPIIGEIILPNYKSMKFSKKKVAVTETEVTGVIDMLRKRLAEKSDVTRIAKKDDEVTIDFKGTDDKGKLVAGAEAKNYPLILGSNAFIPGFEDNILGMKTGDEKNFDIKFPKDYNVAALASKSVNFYIKVTNIQELSLPSINDDFAAKAGPFKTLAALKADILSQLQNERSQEVERNYESEIIQTITKKAKLSVPELLTNSTVEQMLREQKQNLTYKGQTYKEFLELEGITDEQNKAQMIPDAEMRVKASLVLAEIADIEGIKITEQELNQRIDLLKNQYKDESMQSELDKPESRSNIASRILTEKTIDFIKENVSK